MDKVVELFEGTEAVSRESFNQRLFAINEHSQQVKQDIDAINQPLAALKQDLNAHEAGTVGNVSGAHGMRVSGGTVQHLANGTWNNSSVTNSSNLGGVPRNTWVATSVYVAQSNQEFSLTIPNFVFSEGCTVSFKASAPPAGTIVTFIRAGGKVYDLRLTTNEVVPDTAWVANAWVSVILTSQKFPLGSNAGRDGTAFFKMRGMKPPTSWQYLQGYTSSGTFIAPETGWYRSFVFGACGNGGYGENYRIGTGGKGGSTGGLSVHQRRLNKGQQVPITVTASISSFGNYCSATAGGANGGAAGTATGGNITNLSGYVGSAGGESGDAKGDKNGRQGVDGVNGGMKGGLGGRRTGSIFPGTGGGGGGGGARLQGDNYCKYISPAYTELYQAGEGGRDHPPSSYTPSDSTPYPPVVVGENMKLFGGGGGGGGYSASVDRGGNPSIGTPGVVIIEKGLR